MAACSGRRRIAALIRRNSLLFRQKTISASTCSHLAPCPNGFLKKENLPLINKRFLHSSVALSKLSRFLLSDPGEGIREVTIKKWLVQPGDQVNHFDDLCEAETDKATLTLTSPYDGVIKKIYYEEDSIAIVGQPLIDFETADDVGGDTVEDIADPEPVEVDTVTKSQLNISENDSRQTTNVSGRKLATPAVRKMAMEKNITLSDITGTGKDGRILKDDIINFLKKEKTAEDTVFPLPTVSVVSPSPEPSIIPTTSPTTPPLTSVPPSYATTLPLVEDKTEPIKGFKKAMVKTMSDALKIPHFGYSDEIILNELISFRENAKDLVSGRGVRLSFMPMFIKAASMALKHFPVLNSIVDDSCESITYKACHNIGIAMDTDQGLVVPNIKEVQNKTIFEVAKEVNYLQQIAIAGKLELEHLQGGTFTLSNIGSLGGTYCDPVILPPQVSIGAIGKAQAMPRYNENNDIFKAYVMCVSWSADHRVIDGATMCKFSNLWKSYLENPSSMLIDLR